MNVRYTPASRMTHLEFAQLVHDEFKKKSSLNLWAGGITIGSCKAVSFQVQVNWPCIATVREEHMTIWMVPLCVSSLLTMSRGMGIVQKDGTVVGRKS